jgi:hypothetical protein
MNEAPRIRIVIIEAQSESVIGEVLRELGSVERTRGIFIERVENMGDTYNVSGQAGAVGHDAKSESSTFIKSSGSLVSDEELVALAAQLEVVRLAMKERITGSPSAEQDEQIGQIAKAQIAAEQGNQSGAISHLKNVGKWAMSVAKDTGAEIVARILSNLIVH